MEISAKTDVGLRDRQEDRMLVYPRVLGENDVFLGVFDGTVGDAGFSFFLFPAFPSSPFLGANMGVNRRHTLFKTSHILLLPSFIFVLRFPCTCATFKLPLLSSSRLFPFPSLSASHFVQGHFMDHLFATKGFQELQLLQNNGTLDSLPLERRAAFLHSALYDV